MFDIIAKRFRFFLISGILIVISIIALATLGLKPSIEFSSGSILTITFEQQVTVNDLRSEMANLGYANAIIQTTSAGDILIRTKEITKDEKATLEEGLQTKFGTLTERGFESVDPLIARQTSRSALIAVAVAAIGIMLYITWAFRKMPQPLRYGSCAVIALLHDVLVTVGLFSILGGIYGWEIDLMFITGILAILGYSVNNTVVIFDRIRENKLRAIQPDFEALVNNSVLETITRSLNTSITTIITITAVLLFVGATVRNFAVVLLIGIPVGLYDSTFVAPALLVVWDKHEWRRFLPWMKRSKAIAP